MFPANSGFTGLFSQLISTLARSVTWFFKLHNSLNHVKWSVQACTACTHANNRLSTILLVAFCRSTRIQTQELEIFFFPSSFIADCAHMLMSFDDVVKPRDGITHSTHTRVFISLTENEIWGRDWMEKNPLRSKLDIDGFWNFSTVKNVLVRSWESVQGLSRDAISRCARISEPEPSLNFQLQTQLSRAQLNLQQLEGKSLDEHSSAT